MRKWNCFFSWGSSRCFKIEIITWVSNNNDHVQSEFISNEWAESITIYRKEYNILCPDTIHHSVVNTNTHNAKWNANCQPDIMHMHFCFSSKIRKETILHLCLVHITIWQLNTVSMFSERNDFHFVVLECNFECENLIGQMWLRRMMDFFLALSRSLSVFRTSEAIYILKFRWKFYWTANNWSWLPF